MQISIPPLVVTSELSSQRYLSSTSSQYPLLVCCHSFSPTNHLSSLKITYRSFRYASPRLWNQLPDSFCQPHQSCLDSPPHPFVNPSLLSSPLSSSTTHSFTLSLQVQNLPFQRILPTLDFFYLLDCLHDNGTGPDLSRSSLYF